MGALFLERPAFVAYTAAAVSLRWVRQELSNPMAMNGPQSWAAMATTMHLARFHTLST